MIYTQMLELLGQIRTLEPQLCLLSLYTALPRHPGCVTLVFLQGQLESPTTCLAAALSATRSLTYWGSAAPVSLRCVPFPPAWLIILGWDLLWGVPLFFSPGSSSYQPKPFLVDTPSRGVWWRCLAWNLDLLGLFI